MSCHDIVHPKTGVIEKTDGLTNQSSRYDDLSSAARLFILTRAPGPNLNTISGPSRKKICRPAPDHPSGLNVFFRDRPTDDLRFGRFCFPKKFDLP